MIHKMLLRLWVYFAPYGTSARILIGCYMMAQGTARVFFSTSLTGGVNVFPGRIYGALMVLGGITLLLTTPARYRYKWSGRIVAIVCASIWMLLIAQAWGSWISISGAVIFTLALVNEVRANA